MPDQNGNTTMPLPGKLAGASPFHAPVPNWKVVTPLSNWLNGPSSWPMRMMPTWSEPKYTASRRTYSVLAELLPDGLLPLAPPAPGLAAPDGAVMFRP